MEEIKSYKFGPAGGLGGDPYDATQSSEWRIFRVKGREKDRIDQIQLVWIKGTTIATSDPFGSETGGDPFCFHIENGDYLTKIEGSVDKNANTNQAVRVFSLKFFTKNGGESVTYGTEPVGALKFYFECPPDYQIIGIFGRAKGGVDALGVYIVRIPVQ